MTHVFISYSSKNSDYAHSFADKLLEEGFDVWIDNRLRTSENWWESIVMALRGCAAFVVIMTPESRASKWVQREVLLADEWLKPTFPLLLAGNNWPIFVATQYEEVEDGRFPSAGFYDHLATIAPRKNTKGSNLVLRDSSITIEPDEEFAEAIANPPVQEYSPSTQKRRLEAAMPACSTLGAKTQLKVKITLPNSKGLKGELPKVLPSGDIIQQGDVLRTRFTMQFPTEAMGSISAGTVCIDIVTDDYYVSLPHTGTKDRCIEDQFMLDVPPYDDSRTLNFSLKPKSSDKTGLSTVYIYVYQNGELITNTTVQTHIVKSLNEHPICGNWRLNYQLISGTTSSGNKPDNQQTIIDTPVNKSDNQQTIGTVQGGTVIGGQGNTVYIDTVQNRSARSSVMVLAIIVMITILIAVLIMVVPGFLSPDATATPTNQVVTVPSSVPTDAPVNTTIPTSIPIPTSSGKDEIAFVSERSGVNQIYLMNADGSNLRQLTNTDRGNEAPSWSPDGSQIAFVSHWDGNAEIYVMNADGSNSINLTNNPADDTSPSWSPDGARIAFTSNRDGNNEIYVMNANGGNPHNLTANPADDSSPTWSPDSSQIAYTTNRDSNAEIYVMNADGSSPHNITQNPAEDSTPAWSPDGAQIAYTTNRDGNAEIYVMNADGSNPRNLTRTPYLDELPSWSPDGTRLAFDSLGSGNYQINVINADGTHQTNISNNSAYADGFAAWRPSK